MRLAMLVMAAMKKEQNFSVGETLPITESNLINPSPTGIRKGVGTANPSPSS